MKGTCIVKREVAIGTRTTKISTVKIYMKREKEGYDYCAQVYYFWYNSTGTDSRFIAVYCIPDIEGYKHCNM